MFWHGNRNILRLFNDGNVIVAGHKGNGKDLLFQYVIKAREKSGAIHAANITYTDKTTLRSIDFYKLENNTVDNFIGGNFNKERKVWKEREDYYISDVGTALPAQFGKKLEKKFPTFPIFYALSRHIADMNIHCNVQNFGRVWDKLREQADYYIWCRWAKVWFGRFAIQSVIIYDRYQSALANIQPYKCKRRLFGLIPPKPEDYARANEHNAKYGTIRKYTFWHILPKKHYDTRYFHKALFKEEAPKIIPGKKKKK